MVEAGGGSFSRAVLTCRNLTATRSTTSPSSCSMPLFTPISPSLPLLLVTVPFLCTLPPLIFLRASSWRSLSLSLIVLAPRSTGEYEPSTQPIASQAGLQPISPMNVNAAGRSGAADDSQQQRQQQQAMQVGNGNVGNGDGDHQRRGGNRFLDMLLCRCG